MADFYTIYQLQKYYFFSKKERLTLNLLFSFPDIKKTEGLIISITNPYFLVLKRKLLRFVFDSVF